MAINQDRTLRINDKQAYMIGRFIAHQHKTLQITANKHRQYHSNISDAAHEYINETQDLLKQLEMEYLIYPRGHRTSVDEEDQF